MAEGYRCASKPSPPPEHSANNDEIPAVCGAHLPVPRARRVIGIQTAAPRLVTCNANGLSHELPHARPWAGLLVAVPPVLAALCQRPGLWQPDLVIVAGLSLFALPFAVNSSLHE